MSLEFVERLSIDFSSRPIEVEVSAAPLTSDAGLLPIRQADEAWGITEAFAAALYAMGYRISIVDSESFHPQTGKKLRQLSFGCAPGFRLDLVTAMKSAGLSVNGYRNKPTVLLADEERAVKVVRRLLSAPT